LSSYVPPLSRGHPYPKDPLQWRNPIFCSI